MRSLLSQYQTPAFPRRSVGFFGFGRPAGRPAFRITQPTSDWQRFLKPTLSAVDANQLIPFREVVNARFWCNWRLGPETIKAPNALSVKASGRVLQIPFRNDLLACGNLFMQ